MGDNGNSDQSKLREKLQKIISNYFPKLKVDLSQFVTTEIIYERIKTIELVNQDDSEGFILVRRNGDPSEARDRAVEDIVTKGAYPNRGVLQFYYLNDTDFPAGCHWVRNGVFNG